MVLKINYFLIKKVKKVDYKFIKNGLKIAEFLWDILVFFWNILWDNLWDILKKCDITIFELKMRILLGFA